MEKQNTNVTTDEIKSEVIEEQVVPKKKKKKIGRVILNVFTTILFIVIVLEAAVGIINMNRISNKEEPVWYLSTKTTETELKTVTEYNLGLYKIVKTDTSKETKITLKPFFLND